MSILCAEEQVAILYAATAPGSAQGVNIRPLQYLSKHIAIGLLIVTVAASLAVALVTDNGALNLHVLQAAAFLDGRLDIDTDLEDVASRGDLSYVPFPPLPAVLVVPVVAIVGVKHTSPVAISIALTVVNVLVLVRLQAQLNGLHSTSTIWLITGFFLGTAYWSTVYMSTGVWFFAHIVATTFLLCAVNEALSRGRGALVGLFLGFAFLSRQLTVYAIFFLVTALLKNDAHRTTRSKTVSLIWLVAVFGACALAYLAFNWMRFGDPLDTGYSRIVLTGFLERRVKRFGLFHPVYVPFNLTHMFLQGFHVVFEGSRRLVPTGMDPFGTSVTVASPFLFFAIYARGSRSVRMSAWISIGLCVVHMLFYYNNGFVQWNAQRFSLDFLPVLAVLLALSIGHTQEGLWKAAIGYSVFLNVITMWLVMWSRYRGG